jgi:hypothetical protein
MAIELLLADEEGRPFLSEGLPDEAAAPEKEEEEAGFFGFPQIDKDPNDLKAQPWALIVPEGPEGKRLEEIVAPLRAFRKEQQGKDPIVFRAPAGMSAEQAGEWWATVYNSEDIALRDRPRYLLILGDANLISWESQQRFASSAFVGRLAFAKEAGYEAYMHKLLAYERAALSGPQKLRAMFHTVRDGTAATSIGHRGLMSPTVAAAQEGLGKNEFQVDKIVDLNENGPLSPDDFLRAAALRDPTLLFSISHGLGMSAETAEEERRRFQGAMSFGQGKKITADDVANKPFLPGGAWFFFACFSAGTPAETAYRHWLQNMKDAGVNVRQSDIDAVLTSLAREKSFVAALPQAALANPDGPLAVMGHVDLAWTFSFQDASKKFRPSRFHGTFQGIVDHSRIGCSFFDLQRVFIDANSDLTDMLDAEERARRKNETLPDAKTRPQKKASLWMLRQDLTAYVLLGDPATRVAAVASAEEVRKVPSIVTGSATSVERAPTLDTKTEASAPGGATGAFAETPPAMTNSLANIEPARIEEAVFAKVDDEAMNAIARQFSVARGHLDAWIATYKEGGLAAVRAKRSV